MMNNEILPPDSLLDQLGILEPQDLDVEAIAFYCGAEVRYAALSGCAARIIGAETQAIITVDPRFSTPQRQRFSIAHELGHWMRDRGRASFLCEPKDINSPWRGRTDKESRANQYAADLLMPRFMFQPLARHGDMTFSIVENLASDFNTSKTAAAIRLVELGPYPAMLVCHSVNGRLWFSRGPDVPYEVWPRRELDHDSPAFELLFGDKKQPRPLEVDADMWIDHRDAHQYTLVEDSIKVADDAIITLLWWKDESQLVELQ